MFYWRGSTRIPANGRLLGDESILILCQQLVPFWPLVIETGKASLRKRGSHVHPVVCRAPRIPGIVQGVSGSLLNTI